MPSCSTDHARNPSQTLTSLDAGQLTLRVIGNDDSLVGDIDDFGEEEDAEETDRDDFDDEDL